LATLRTKDSQATTWSQYRRAAYQFIAFYRYLTFAAASVLMIALPLGRGGQPEAAPLLSLAVTGLYTAFKVVFPTRESQGDFRSYVFLALDAAICLVTVMATGGLDSGLLLYSFTPVIIAASFYNERSAIAVAVLFAAALGIGHTVLNHFTSEFAWILQDNLLSLYAAYTVASLLIASVAYRANLNVRQRIERSSIMEERRRLRLEIHDGIAQSLGYLNLKTGLIRNSLPQANGDNARVLAELDDMKKATAEAYTDIRESIDSLTVTAETFSLTSSLHEYVREFAQRSGIEVDFQDRLDGGEVSPLTELQALRIVQEALRNVRKHAQATKVEVALSRMRNNLVLSVHDNGNGMTDSSRDNPGHHGLEVMRERAEGLGGALSVHSEVGKGTEVKAVLPLGGAESP